MTIYDLACWGCLFKSTIWSLSSLLHNTSCLVNFDSMPLVNLLNRNIARLVTWGWWVLAWSAIKPYICQHQSKSSFSWLCKKTLCMHLLAHCFERFEMMIWNDICWVTYRSVQNSLIQCFSLHMMLSFGKPIFEKIILHVCIRLSALSPTFILSLGTCCGV